MEDLLLAVIALIIVLGILGGFIARGILFLKRFNSIACGMHYDQVVSIIGQPYNSARTEDINTCVWRVSVLRGIRITRIIIFKNDKVFSIADG